MKKQPSSNDLRAWLIFFRLDQTPDSKVTPELISQWLEEFDTTPRNELIERFIHEYKDFKFGY